MVLDVIAGTVGAELVAGAIRGGAAKPHDPNQLVIPSCRITDTCTVGARHRSDVRPGKGYVSAFLLGGMTVTVRVPRSGVSAIEEHAEEMRVAAGYKPSILDRVVMAFSRKPTKA